jgi:hypothetical protein
MRRVGSGFALLGLILLLGSCAVTPPVLGGRQPTSTPAVDAWTDEDLAALLILDDPESENVVLAVADYRDGVVAEVPDVEPAGCRDSFAPLLLVSRDATATGSVVVSPPLFREAPGADLLVAQVGRRFDSAAEASAFAEELRLARAECPGFATADGIRTERAIVDGDFAVAAIGFASTTTSAEGGVVESFEWMLVHDEVALSISADVSDDDDRDILTALTAEYAALLAP